MDLKLNDKDVSIFGLTIPQTFQTSLRKRGKSAVNHRYEEKTSELQVKCSTCQLWHSVYKLKDEAWEGINQSYRVCNAGKQNAYFDAYCNHCYSKKDKHDNQTTEDDGKSENKEQELKSISDKSYLPWSEKMGGKQSSIFLFPEHETYLKLYGVLHNKRKNQIINEIIARFMEENPINI
jgi:hypothetical protein